MAPAIKDVNDHLKETINVINKRLADNINQVQKQCQLEFKKLNQHKIKYYILKKISG